VKKKKYVRQMNAWLAAYRLIHVGLHRDIGLFVDAMTRLTDALEADARFRKIIEKEGADA
jgi:hypothetical protein